MLTLLRHYTNLFGSHGLLLFADRMLRREGIPEERIHFVGNVMIDTLVRRQRQPLVEAAREALDGGGQWRRPEAPPELVERRVGRRDETNEGHTGC